MTSHPQTNHYHNNGNDALSCYTRKICDTFDRKGRNNQYVYGTTNGTISVQRQPFETVGYVNADASDLSRSYRNNYLGNNDDLILTDTTTSTTVSSTSLVSGGATNYTLHLSNEYNINDNVICRSQMYESCTTDSCKTDGDVGGVGANCSYSYNVSLATVGSYDHTTYKRCAASDHPVAKFNDADNEKNSMYGTWTQSLYNGGENVSGKNYSVVSAKMLPRIPMKQSINLLGGMNPYDDIKLQQPQRFDANMLQTTSSILQLEAVVEASSPQYRKSTQIQVPAGAGYHITSATEFLGTPNISAVGCTTDQHNKLRNRTQLLQDGNMRPAAQTISSNTKTTTPTMETATNSDYIAHDNATIRKSYENFLNDDIFYNRTLASTKQRINTSMGQPELDFLAYEDHRVSYNNKYNNCINTDSLSMCTDTSSNTLGPAQKLQLQHQRKHAIMMEMTTASVIASGETRIPIKRITEGKQPHKRNIELTASGVPHNDEVTSTRAKNINDYGFLVKENVSAVSTFCGRTCTRDKTISTAIAATTSNTVIAHLTQGSMSTIKATKDDKQNNSSADTAMLQKTSPNTVSLVAPSRKLPKRLPSLKYDSCSNSNSRNNNNSSYNYHHKTLNNNDGKVNEICKKLPKLPIEEHKTVASTKYTSTKIIPNTAVSGKVCIPEAMQSLTLTYEIKTTTPIEASATTTTTQLTTLTMPSLNMDTFRGVLTSSLTCSTPTSVSESTASTAPKASLFSSAYIASSYSPTYLAYLSDTITTTTITNCETTADKYLISLEPSKEGKESNITKTAISTATTTSSLYEIPITTFVSNVPFVTYETDDGTSNLAELITTTVSSKIVPTTTTKNAYNFGDSKIGSYIYSYDNNCTALDEYTRTNSNVNANNSIICGVPKAAITIATTRSTPTPTVLLSNDLPFYLKQYSKMIPAFSNSGCTVDTSSSSVNLHANYLQSRSTTSTSTSSFSNSSLTSPSITVPSYTFNCISYTSAALPVLQKPSAEIETATATTPISIPTTLILTKPNLTSPFSSNDTGSFSNSISSTYYISSKTMDDNSNIYDEYLNKCGNSSKNNFMLPTSTKLTTATTTTVSISSIISSVSLPLPSLITSSPSNSIVQTTATSMELPILTTAAPQNTSIEYYPESSIVTATSNSNKLELQLTTTIDSSTNSIANATTPTAATTSTTKYQYQMITTTVESADKNGCNSNSTTDIKSELPKYVKDFLNCDMSKPNFSDDSLVPFDLSLATCEYNNYLNINGYSLHSMDTTASRATAPSIVKSKKRVESVTSMSDINRDDSATHKCANNAIIPTMATTVTTTAAAAIVDGNIMEFLLTSTPSNQTITATVVSSDGIVDAMKCADFTFTKTTMPALTTATVQSIARAFDDNFYDSYSVDWSTLTPFTAVEGFDVAAESNVTYGATMPSLSAKSRTTTTTTSATAISHVNLAAEGGYYRPMSALKTTETATADITIDASFSVTGKATSVLGGISKGFKGGLDGVFSGVNVAATSDTNTKPQQHQSSKKSSFGLGLASKYVPNVGGLLAGAATVAVQQTNNVVKAAKGNSDIATGAKITDTTATATKISIAATTQAMQYPMASVTYEVAANSSNSNSNYNTNATLIQHHLDQCGEPLYTNSRLGNMKMTSYDMSDNAGYDQKINIQAEGMLLNATYMMHGNSHDSVGSVDNITYMQEPGVMVTSDIKNICYYDDGYNAADVIVHRDISVVNDEYVCTDYNDGYEIDILQTDDEEHSVTYAKQRTVDNSKRVVGADENMTNNTAMVNENMMTSYYLARQQFKNEHKSQLQQQQERRQQSERASSLVKKATSSQLPAITNSTAHAQSQRLTIGGVCTSNDMMPLPTASTVTTRITTGGGGATAGGGMFGSFLGKAAAAVQSATQAVNQATTAVHQKAIVTAVISATTTVATTSTITAAETGELIQNNDHNSHQHQQQPERQQKMLLHQKSLSSQYSASATISADNDNRNLYNSNNNAGADATVPDAAKLHYPNYYINGNQSQLQNQHQSSKSLPTVPATGFTGKKLPTINACKLGFLIKQQPTEIYDDDLIIDDVSDTNGHHLSDGDVVDRDDGGVGENDGEIIDELNENDLSNIEVIEYDGGVELDRYIVEGHIGDKLNPKKQCSDHIQPNYEIDSEHADYYIDSQLHAPPSDEQQKLSKCHERSLAGNSYYEHTNGGYDNHEDYFNEEDEYKYLEKEELFHKQQPQQNNLQRQQNLLQQNQRERQNNYQYDNGGDIYLEENYQSEDSGNYLDESSSSSVIGAMSSGAKGNKQPTIELTESQNNIENGVLNTMRPATTIAPADNKDSLVNGTSAYMASSIAHQHQHQIKKQDSIILEEDEDDILINEMSVNNVVRAKDEQTHHRGASHESMTENDDDIMSEMPSLSIVASKKKMLLRGETEEVVSGHMHMLRKPEVTSKRRWHWAYNKIIMQLNVSKK